jgi:hypothetical protein
VGEQCALDSWRPQYLQVSVGRVPGCYLVVQRRGHFSFTRVRGRGQPVEKVGLELIATKNRAPNTLEPVYLVAHLDERQRRQSFSTPGRFFELRLYRVSEVGPLPGPTTTCQRFAPTT